MYPAMQATAGKIGANNDMSAKIFGFIGTFQSLGLIASPLVVGLDYEKMPKAFFPVLGAISFLTLIIYLLIIRAKSIHSANNRLQR